MIPNIIHFVFGLDPLFGNRPFMLFHYIAIKSAYEVNRPKKIFFVCAYEPESVWFEKSKPYLDIIKIIPPTQIFGNPLCHYAHQSDVLRLERLIEYGGIYLDLDTICVKPLTQLLEKEFVMGAEFVWWSDNHEEPLKKYFKGLCNAVILAKPNSPFLLKWYESYKTFRSKGKDQYWAEHSIDIPGKLSKIYSYEIEVLGEEAFFYPSWDEEGLKKLFKDDHVFPNAYVHHLWESAAWDQYLSKITVASIINEDTTYNIIARRFLIDR